MNKLQGKGVSGGTAIGNIFFYKKFDNVINKTIIDEPDKEIQRFKVACEKASAQLQQLSEKSMNEVSEEAAQIFMIQSMMIEDDDYQECILSIIKEEKVCAEYAVFASIAYFTDFLKESGVDYIENRKSDVEDISNRIISILKSKSLPVNSLEVPSIFAAEDLSPSETVLLDRSKILAIITKIGSRNSHTAILARTMGIPAIIGIGDELSESFEGKMAIVDAGSGLVFIEPDDAIISKYREKILNAEAKAHELSNEKGKATVTSDGKKIKLFANIGNLSDIELVKENDAEGIGLFRTEFIFMGRNNLPSEEDQFLIYKNIAEKMSDSEVIIRTLDAGADKQIEYLDIKKEENPALGLRAIRFCFENQEIFKIQLRALYRASMYGNILIMFPMIISVEEVFKIKTIIKEVWAEMDADNVRYNRNTPIGIMIETPAAALISSDLASEVDFFSIGTNDLAQYTLAVDRQNPRLDNYAAPHHKAVLQLIKDTVKNAHNAGIWVGICGNLASDIDMLDFFVEIDIDELSVEPSKVLAIRKSIRRYKK